MKLVRATRPETRGDRRRATARGTERYAPVYAPRVRAEPVAPQSNLASRARGRARARSPRAVPAKTHQPLVSLTSAGKAQHEMAGADGATEVPPDATYAALEGPRFVTAPEPARQSVLSHSKSHPRMLESASTTAHSPARACAMDTSLLARPNDPRRLSLSGAPLTARDSLALTQVMPRRTSGPSALSRSSWTSTHPRDSSRSPVREIARASRSAGGRVQILAAVGEFVSREFSPARAKA